jgi:hypothetical protein
MRTIFLVAICFLSLLFVAPCMAAVIDVNLTNKLIEGSFSGPCYCATNLWSSPVISVAPGDTVDFGSVNINTYQSGPTPDAGPDQPAFFLAYPSVAVSTDPSVLPRPDVTSFVYTSCAQGDTACYNSALGWSFLNTLEFVTPTGSIQISWVGDTFEYIPPAVPELSTWAMLLMGFTAIGFIGRRLSWQKPFHFAWT